MTLFKAKWDVRVENLLSAVLDITGGTMSQSSGLRQLTFFLKAEIAWEYLLETGAGGAGCHWVTESWRSGPGGAGWVWSSWLGSGLPPSRSPARHCWAGGTRTRPSSWLRGPRAAPARGCWCCSPPCRTPSPPQSPRPPRLFPSLASHYWGGRLRIFLRMVRLTFRPLIGTYL